MGKQTGLFYDDLVNSSVRKMKPYECEYCGKVLSGSTALKRHHRVHTGEKPFAYPVCAKPFRQKEHLKAHMLLHYK